MPTVRTTCPNCETVIVDAGSLTLRRRLDSAHSECQFTCPTCASEVVHELTDRMVPVLIGAGCQVEDWETSDRTSRSMSRARLHHPSSGAITAAEIDEFVAALAGDSWMDELLR